MYSHFFGFVYSDKSGRILITGRRPYVCLVVLINGFATSCLGGGGRVICMKCSDRRCVNISNLPILVYWGSS